MYLNTCWLYIGNTNHSTCTTCSPVSRIMQTFVTQQWKGMSSAIVEELCESYIQTLLLPLFGRGGGSTSRTKFLVSYRNPCNLRWCSVFTDHLKHNHRSIHLQGYQFVGVTIMIRNLVCSCVYRLVKIVPLFFGSYGCIDLKWEWHRVSVLFW